MPKPLIAAAELAARLASPNPPTVLDVRWKLGAPSGYGDYLAGHIPGAAFVEVEQDLCGPAGEGGRHPLPDPAKLQVALRAAGVGNDREVVVYDYGDSMASARAWWTLKFFNHSRVLVLSGGFPAWQAAAGAVTSEPTVVTPGDFEVRPGGMPLLDAQGAAAMAKEGVLLDARAPERFRGETEPIDPVAGRVPGAVNLPYAKLASGEAKLPLDAPAIGAYCGSGITAAHTVLALHEAGREDAALYVGSWSNWITDPSRPIATGEPS